jgi:hypothetical protein
VADTNQRLAAWRAEIVRARIALASEHLPYAKRLELWLIVDGREACIKLSGSSFSSEMEQVDRELEAALRCS